MHGIIRYTIIVHHFNELSTKHLLTMITALNKKHQKQVNKAYKYLAKYDQNNTLRDHAEGDEDEKAFKKYDRICIDAFDKYLDALAELPKREADRIEKIYYK